MTQVDHKSWPQLLDEFERSLEWHEEHLATADSDSEPSWSNPWSPPADVDALPESLRLRAEALLERSATLEAAVLEKMAAVSPNGSSIHRRRTHQTKHASSTFSTKL